MKKEEKINNASEPKFKRNIGMLHSKIADWLNWNCKKLSAQTLMATLILFCAMAGLYFLSLIFGILN